MTYTNNVGRGHQKKSTELFPICIVSNTAVSRQLRNESQILHDPSVSYKGNKVFKLYQTLLNRKRVLKWSPNYKF